MVWLDLVNSGVFPPDPVKPVAPGVNHVLLCPGLDEGSSSGCLWWSPMSGEVTHMCHTSRNGLSH